MLFVLITGFVLGFFVQKIIEKKRKRVDSDHSVKSFSAQIYPQIYHDLQSPLSALSFLIKSSEAFDESTKVHLTEIAQQLRKLSNHLLAQFSGNQPLQSQQSEHLQNSQASSLKIHDWKVNRIQFTLPSDFVILDDQPFAHEQWERKLKSSLSPEQENQITRHHLKSHSEFMNWYQDHDYGGLENVLYLFDMDLGEGSPETGLDLIDRLNLQKRAILVTNQADDPRVQKLCEIRKTHLLAKSDISLVPLVYTRFL